MFTKNTGVNTCARLLEKYSLSPKPFQPEKMVFSGVGNRDVYNITAPFEDEGELVIAGRVEARDQEHSEVYFFVNRGGEWVPREGAPSFSCRTPFTRGSGRNWFSAGCKSFPIRKRKIPSAGGRFFIGEKESPI